MREEEVVKCRYVSDFQHGVERGRPEARSRLEGVWRFRQRHLLYCDNIPLVIPERYDWADSY